MLGLGLGELSQIQPTKRLLEGSALGASGFRLYSFTANFTGAHAFVQLLTATLTSKNVAIHDLPLSSYCLDVFILPPLASLRGI